MHIQNKIFLAVLIMSALYVAGCQKGSGSLKYTDTWEELYDMTVQQPVRMAAFLDDKYGVTGGYAARGRANFTKDGGETWMISSSSGSCLYGVEVVNEETVWVAGRRDLEEDTNPGGVRVNNGWGDNKAWGGETQLPFTAGELPMSFLDDKRGWTGLRTYIGETLDGGLTRNKIPTPSGIRQVRAVQMLDNGKGFFLDDKGVLYFTDDYGENWIERNLFIGDLEGLKLVEYEGVSSAIRFKDEQSGILVMCVRNGENIQTIIMTTENGGQKWKTEILRDGGGVLFVSPNMEYITLTDPNGHIYVYRNV